MLKTKIVSSQEKVFLDDSIDSFEPLRSLRALGGETVNFQLIYVDVPARLRLRVSLPPTLRFAT